MTSDNRSKILRTALRHGSCDRAALLKFTPSSRPQPHQSVKSTETGERCANKKERNFHSELVMDLSMTKSGIKRRNRSLTLAKLPSHHIAQVCRGFVYLSLTLNPLFPPQDETFRQNSLKNSIKTYASRCTSCNNDPRNAGDWSVELICTSPSNRRYMGDTW